MRLFELLFFHSQSICSWHLAVLSQPLQFRVIFSLDDLRGHRVALLARGLAEAG